MTENQGKIQQLAAGGAFSKAELAALIASYTPEDRAFAAALAREVSQARFGRKIYIRGLIEFTNFCKNNCLYCGLRRENKKVSRYRLSPGEILSCCAWGYAEGIRTFVLQGGEDPYFTDERLEGIVRAIKSAWPDCAVTLSLGERSRESYRRLFDAGVDRYLLRHETASPEHYQKLHPPELSLESRLACLEALKGIGYQTGCGCMVGAPFQTSENLAEDLLFMRAFQPHMAGIGPFIPHKDTPFRGEKPGSLDATLFLLSLVRLMLPSVLLPATTALGTIAPDGREQGILAGANVLMPNISPEIVRGNYLLYNNKAGTGLTPAESLDQMKRAVSSIGYEAVVDRGDF